MVLNPGVALTRLLETTRPGGLSSDPRLGHERPSWRPRSADK